jgi:hypothetical protein
MASQSDENVNICPLCTYHNEITSVACLVCEAQLDHKRAANVPGVSSIGQSSIGTDSSQTELIDGYIECPHCTFHNPKDLRVCDACSGTLKRKRINPTSSPESPEVFDCQ